MTKKKVDFRYRSLIVTLWSAIMPGIAHAAPVAQPFFLADIDGDGQKDQFFRKYLRNGKVEIGVRLSTRDWKILQGISR